MDYEHVKLYIYDATSQTFDAAMSGNGAVEADDLREAIEMADNRLEAALIGDEICRDCVELAKSYLTDALCATAALPATQGDGE